MVRDPIADLVHRYADAVVERDHHRWADTWAPDATWDLGMGRPIEGRDAIVEVWRRAMARFSAVIQTVFNGTHDVDAGSVTGSGRWYVQEQTVGTDGERGLLLAHYDDAYRLDDGRWSFTARTLTVHYLGPPDLSGPFANAVPDGAATAEAPR